MTAVPRKLSSALEGALAGGGDPATSPLYVFGPLLALIVPAGVAAVTFGPSVWLVVLTIAAVSLMYRLVMGWVTDGSGGSGLSEEEFGSPAVKLNAGITFVEYTLTFAVSVSALVTFIADRIPALDDSVLGIQYRTVVAVAFSLLTGWLVNRGPRTTALAFGPATAGVLILLWTMVITAIVRFGFRLPRLDLRAFTPEYLRYTLGGFARILAVMTGIEVFANLVPAYSGTGAQKSRKAFGSLLIIMGTTSIAMLVVGPAILDLSDPMDEEVSVFTQTMDQLLPEPVALLGTIVGVAVLLSAAAASALGLQNLFVGIRLRRYLPGRFARLNEVGVAPAPVWIEVAIVSLAFVVLGTDEETYLVVYAAGVFILLSMTGWAASKRLAGKVRAGERGTTSIQLAGTTAAAVLTSVATVIVFYERFTAGVWVYLVLLPALYLLLGYFRRRLGAPSEVEERVGTVVERGVIMTVPDVLHRLEADRESARLLVPLDGSPFGLRSLPIATAIAQTFRDSVVLLGVTDGQAPHLEHALAPLLELGVDASTATVAGPVPSAICGFAHREDIGLIVMSTHGQTGARRRVLGSVTDRVIRTAHRPILVVPAHASPDRAPSFDRIVVGLDGSHEAERVIPFAVSFAGRFAGRLELVFATEGSAAGKERAREGERYLAGLVEHMQDRGIHARATVETLEAADAIVGVAARHAADLIMMATHGRGGVERFLLGSVAEAVVQDAEVPVLLVPILEARGAASDEALGVTAGAGG